MKRLILLISILLITAVSYSQKSTKDTLVIAKTQIVSTQDTLIYNQWGTKVSEYEVSYPELIPLGERTAWEIIFLYIYVIFCGIMTKQEEEEVQNEENGCAAIVDLIFNIGELAAETIIGLLFGFLFGITFSMLIAVNITHTLSTIMVVLVSGFLTLRAAFIFRIAFKKFGFPFKINKFLGTISGITIILGFGLSMWYVVIIAIGLYLIAFLASNLLKNELKNKKTD